MNVSYNPWLVSLSIGIAILASFTSLRLAARVAESQGSSNWPWLALGSVSMGIGIWSMHFIGMMAFSVPIQLRYDIGLTLLSLAAAIVTSGFALKIASSAELGYARHIVCSLAMGLGIVTMHYTGMSAIPIVPSISYDPLLLIASVLIAVIASFTALWLAFKLRSATFKYLTIAQVGAALIMGLAIAGMHYTGMAAAELQPGAICRGGVALDSQLFAVSISIATLSLLTITLIAGAFDASLVESSRSHAVRLQSINSRLSHQATHDALTNLPNRAQFLERLQNIIAACDPDHPDHVLAVMLIDLDRFKVVNDSLGHSYGDGLLQEVAARLQKLLAEGDFVARLGGDGFLLMLRAKDTPAVIQTANALVHSLSRVYNIEAMEVHLSASIGITAYPFDRCKADALISHADEAMYEAKHHGGNGYRFFVPGTTVFTKERLQLENDLRIASQLGQLYLHYQPQVDIASGRIVGMEALARWQHPTLGWVPPDEFIPLAEASDLIMQIGRWILEEACRQARAWHERGFQDLSIAVNLSARQFRQPDLLAMILKTVAAHGLRPQHIELELTETVVMTDAHRSFEILEALHRAGFKVAVDDFGTGYSSMSYLKRLPVSKLKIDRSFVGDLGSSVKSDSIVKAVIGLAHGLGMVVVAEGVETKSQRFILNSFGCDQYQGYLFSRPKAASDVEALLKMRPHPLDDELDEAQVQVLLRGAG
jgi:diguanylate cyclase